MSGEAYRVLSTLLVIKFKFTHPEIRMSNWKVTRSSWVRYSFSSIKSKVVSGQWLLFQKGCTWWLVRQMAPSHWKMTSLNIPMAFASLELWFPFPFLGFFFFLLFLLEYPGKDPERENSLWHSWDGDVQAPNTPLHYPFRCGSYKRVQWVSPVGPTHHVTLTFLSVNVSPIKTLTVEFEHHFPLREHRPTG